MKRVFVAFLFLAVPAIALGQTTWTVTPDSGVKIESPGIDSTGKLNFTVSPITAPPPPPPTGTSSIDITKTSTTLKFVATLSSTEVARSGSRLDWIGFVPSGAADSVNPPCDRQWYTNGAGGCTTGPNSVVNPSTITTTFPPNGNYEARLYYNNGLQVLARKSFAIP
jgi:hypothetical protein